MKYTFAASSGYYLAHHGIKGMKWGVRRFQNADGTLTEEGRRRYGYGGLFSFVKKKQPTEKNQNSVKPNETQAAVHKIIANAEYNEDISDKVFDAVGADKRALKEARDVLQKGLEVDREITNEMNRLFKDMTKDEERPYWEAVSEFASMDWFRDVDQLTVEDLGGAGYMGIFEDGQQSNINAYSMYAYKNHLEPELEKLYSKVDQIREYRDEAADIIQKALDEADGENLTVSPNNPKTGNLGKIVRNHMANADYDDWKDTNGQYYLGSAEYAQNFSDLSKEAISKAGL